MAETPGKTPMNAEQVANFMKEDFGKNMEKQIKDMKEEPLDVAEMNDSARIRALKVGISSVLTNKGRDLVYRQVLLCRIQGASYEQIATAMKTTPEAAEITEAEARKCVQNRLRSRKVLPVVGR